MRVHHLVTEDPEQSAVGIVLVDSTDHLLYANPEAVQVLTYPGSKDEASLTVTLNHKLHSILRMYEGGEHSQPAVEFHSGQRHYVCRLFNLNAGPAGEGCPASALVLERRTGLSIKVARVSSEYQLTPREQETVANLVEGLTTKEIAGRMGISHNTVSAFLRMVMVKMSVTSRSAIIGEILKRIGN